MGACQSIGLANHRDRIQALAVDRNGIPALKRDLDLFKCIRCIRDRTRHREHLFWRRHHRIFQGTRLNTAPQ